MDRKWRAFLIVAVGIFISTLDGSILNIANPSIAADFGVSMELVEWVVTAYLLVITASLIFFGRMGDRFGSKKIYTYGFLLFSLGSLGCSLTPSLGSLILARVFQGLGASMLMATGIGIISNTFPSGEKGKALGLTGTVVAIGNMTGPGLGGLILVRFNWPVIFLVNVPIGLVGFYLGLKYLSEPELNPAIKDYDIVGTLLLGSSLSALLLALADNPGIDPILLAVSLGLLLGFYFWEKQASCPVLDFELFKIPTFVRANLIAVVVYLTQTSVFFLLPFYMEIILGYSSSNAGLLMMLTPVTMALAAPTAGYLSDKIGSSRIIAGSLLLLTTAYLILASLNQSQTGLKIVSGLIALGVGMGMFGSPNTSSLLGSIPRHKAGYGGGFIATTRNLSYSLGVTCSVALFTWIFNQQLILLPYQLAYNAANRGVFLSAAGVTLAALFWWIGVQILRPASSPDHQT